MRYITRFIAWYYLWYLILRGKQKKNEKSKRRECKVPPNFQWSEQQSYWAKIMKPIIDFLI